MKININKIVNYNVARIDVLSITITKMSNGSLSLNVPNIWYNSENGIIRRFCNRYTQSELINFMGNTPQTQQLLLALNSLFTENKNSTVTINLNSNILIISEVHTETDENNKVKTVTITYTPEQLLTRGLTMESVSVIITQLASTLT